MDSAAPYYPSRPNNFHTVSLGLLVCLPTFMFAAVSLAFLLLGHTATSGVGVVCGICLGMSLLLMAVRHSRDGPKYWFNLGGLCLVGTLVGMSFSLMNNQRNVGRYWAYEGRRDYTNVLPDEPALSHLDAGRIVFSADASVDVADSTGYTLDGTTYCIAPIVGNAPMDKIQYFAAGINCCSQKGNFTCDDASNAKAHSGLVFLDDPAFVDGPLGALRKAAQSAGAAGGLHPAEDAIFVRWVADLKETQRAYWTSGVHFLAVSVACYLGFSAVSGCAVHFARRPSMKSKLDPRSL